MSLMEADALAALIDRQMPALVLYARQWCRAPDDVVQEAFIKLATLRQPPESPAAWLYRAVRNGAINAARAEKRRSNHEAKAASLSARWFAASDSSSDEATTALAKLPLEQREVIVAHLWGGMTFADIAGIIGASAASAYRRYREGLIALREQMGALCPPNRSIPT